MDRTDIRHGGAKLFLFGSILRRCMNAGIVQDDGVAVDSDTIKADARRARRLHFSGSRHGVKVPSTGVARAVKEPASRAEDLRVGRDRCPGSLHALSSRAAAQTSWAYATGQADSRALRVGRSGSRSCETWIVLQTISVFSLRVSRPTELEDRTPFGRAAACCFSCVRLRDCPHDCKSQSASRTVLGA